MSKIVPLKDFGIPIPPASTDPAKPFDPTDPTNHLIVYYGPKGFKPDYTQAARIDAGSITALSQKTLAAAPDGTAVTYWDDPISTELPGGLGNGDYDFVFTIMDANGDEGDFSPPITATVASSVPPTLGQPVLLG